MELILIDLENKHGATLNHLMVQAGVPVRWIVIRDLNDFLEILKQNIIAIYCLPFIAEEDNKALIDKINELKTKINKDEEEHD